MCVHVCMCACARACVCVCVCKAGDAYICVFSCISHTLMVTDSIYPFKQLSSDELVHEYFELLLQHVRLYVCSGDDIITVFVCRIHAFIIFFCLVCTCVALEGRKEFACEVFDVSIPDDGGCHC